MKHARIVGLIIGGVFAVAATASAQTVAIEGATVWTDADTKIDRGTVVFVNGKISAVGAKVAIPAGAKRVDGKGKVVTAGLIDAMTTVGLSEVSLVSDTNEGAFGAERGGVYAKYRAADGYNESSVSIPLARSHGVTTAITTPYGGFVAGIGAAYGMSSPTGNSEVKREVALYANLGRGALKSNHNSRGMAIARLRELFDDASRYARNKAAFERNQSRKMAASRLDLEALLLVRNRTIPLVVRAHRVSDMRAAVLMAKDLRIRLVIAGATEAWRLAELLAKEKVAVILEPSHNLPSSFDQVLVREDNPALLVKAGVDVMISTLGSASNVRNLRQLAGIATARGLTWNQALAAVTRTPAATFGLGKRGSVSVGGVADLVVWSGDPFELSSAAEVVYIGGVEQPLETRQKRLFRRYRKLP